MTAFLCIVGAALELAGAVAAATTRRVRKGMLLQAAGATLIGVPEAPSLERTPSARVPRRIHPGVGVDRLSGVFLLMLGIAGGPVLVFAAAYLDSSGRGRAVAALTGFRGRTRAAAVRA